MLTVMTEPRNTKPGLQERWRQLQRLPLNFILLSLLVGAGIVQLSFQVGQMAYRAVTWTQETKAARERIAKLERDITILQEAKAAAQNPQYLETLARCQGFVGKDERVIVAHGAPETPSETCHPLRLP